MVVESLKALFLLYFFASGGQNPSNFIIFVAFLSISSSGQKPLSPEGGRYRRPQTPLGASQTTARKGYFGASCLGGHFQFIFKSFWETIRTFFGPFWSQIGPRQEAPNAIKITANTIPFWATSKKLLDIYIYIYILYVYIYIYIEYMVLWQASGLSSSSCNKNNDI